MSKTLLSLILSLGLVLAAEAQSPFPEVWTLADCVEHALAQNITVEQARLRGEIASNNLQTAQFDYLPDLRLGNNLFWNFGLNIDPVTNQISQQSRQTANFHSGGFKLFANSTQSRNSRCC